MSMTLSMSLILKAYHIMVVGCSLMCREGIMLNQSFYLLDLTNYPCMYHVLYICYYSNVFNVKVWTWSCLRGRFSQRASTSPFTIMVCTWTDNCRLTQAWEIDLELKIEWAFMQARYWTFIYVSHAYWNVQVKVICQLIYQTLFMQFFNRMISDNGET